MGPWLTSYYYYSPHPTIEKEKGKYHNLKKYKTPKVGKRLREIFLGLCQTLGPTYGLRIALKTKVCLGREGLGLGPLLVWTLT